MKRSRWQNSKGFHSDRNHGGGGHPRHPGGDRYSETAGPPGTGRRTKAKVEIKSLEEALDLYKLDNGSYPTTEQGLPALVKKPEVGRIPTRYHEGGYLKKVPVDPWGSQYIYLSPGIHGDLDIISYGSDGEPGGNGKNADVNSWELE